MYPVKALIFIRALTPLHVGSGRGFATHADVPLQRDEFNFPVIWSSSLKGALRANCSYVGLNNSLCKILFGPEPREGVLEISSAISITDARLTILPARTLRGVWTYITSPHLLEYLSTYMKIKGGKGLNLQNLITDKVVANNKNLLIDEKKIFLNEVELDAEVKPNLIETIGLNNVLPQEILSSVNSKGLVVVPDNVSRTLVNRSTILHYRVRLSVTKTVEPGALWSEEYLPIETTLVSLTAFKERAKLEAEEQQKKEPSEYNAENLKNEFMKYNEKIVFVGGRETIGKGLIKLYLI